MARSKSYPDLPVVVSYYSTAKGRKLRKKVFKTKNIDEVIDGLENGTLWGVPKTAEIKHIGIGSRFI